MLKMLSKYFRNALIFLYFFLKIIDFWIVQADLNEFSNLIFSAKNKKKY